MTKLDRQEKERIRLAFFAKYKGEDGFRSCSLRYNDTEGDWIHLGVADLALDWLPEEFEGVSVWAEEEAPFYNATLPPSPRP